ncbi:MAG: AhpC/TSA family protein [Proteobacteria bacterium]|nr:AhpC/TSA family protein [Pseudomonadota bacterium]
MTAKPLRERLDEAFEHCCAMDAPLRERLSRFSKILGELIPTYHPAVDSLVERLRANSAGQKAPMPGEPMPPFQLPDEHGRIVSLRDLLDEGPLVVALHRGHWCPYCRMNTRALAEADAQARARGGRIVAIMPERGVHAQQLRGAAIPPFPILSDIDNGYSLSLNLAIWLGTELRDYLTSRGYDLAAYQGNDSWIVPIPATFVVARDGRVMSRFVDPDYRNRMETADLLAALRGAG